MAPALSVLMDEKERATKGYTQNSREREKKLA